MIVIYPKEYMSNAPNNNSEVEFIFTGDPIPLPSGMFDTFLMVVEHESKMADLNYELSFCNNKNRHIVKTMIDCNFQSRNLELLIKKFKAIEDIWNYEG
jgi:hypothetical protein